MPKTARVHSTYITSYTYKRFFFATAHHISEGIPPTSPPGMSSTPKSQPQYVTVEMFKQLESKVEVLQLLKKPCVYVIILCNYNYM